MSTRNPPAPPIRSWGDGYAALRRRAGDTRGWIELDSDAWDRRWPRTTGRDAIVIAAFIDEAFRTTDQIAFAGTALRWASCKDDLERDALQAPGDTYRGNRDFWPCLAMMCSHLSYVGAPLPSQAAWHALLAEIGARSRHRDASWFSIKTPGVILAEMRSAKNEVESLGRDIYATFRRPFEAQLAAAEKRFFETYGRKPGVGRQAQDTDYQTVHAWMRPVPTAEDLRHISYQGQFVYQWGEFEREFGNFFASHSGSWTERMWRGAYDKAVEYRERAAEWRKRFETLGGSPTTPPPKPPTEHILPPGVSMPWKELTVVGGIAAGVLVLPAVIRAFRRDGDRR